MKIVFDKAISANNFFSKGLGLILENCLQENVLGLTTYGMHRARIAYKTYSFLNVPYS